MPVNIIVRHGKSVEWDKVVEIQRQRENDRRAYFNREGCDELALRSRRVIASLNTKADRDVLVVDRQLDGLLMDQCRELNGHADWRRDSEFLKWVGKQPEFSGFAQHQKAKLDQLICENKNAVLTPAQSVDKGQAAQRQADLAKLPARYKVGLEA